MARDEEKTPLERTIDFIDEIVDPDAMTKDEYRQFLEDLETDIAGRIEACDEDDDLDDEESDVLEEL